MDKVLAEVVDRLISQTRAGKVQWEDVSTMSGGERFRVNFGDMLVDVREGERVEQSDLHGETHVSYIRVQVLNDRGFVVASAEHDIGGPYHRKLGELLDTARASARRREALLENLLQRLGK